MEVTVGPEVSDGDGGEGEERSNLLPVTHIDPPAGAILRGALHRQQGHRSWRNPHSQQGATQHNGHARAGRHKGNWRESERKWI